jgi:hypothetical protein
MFRPPLDLRLFDRRRMIRRRPRPKDANELGISNRLLFQERLGEGVQSVARLVQELMHRSLASN